MKTLLFILLSISAVWQLQAQPSFVKVTDSSNPIVTNVGVTNGSYAGCAWIDYDGDGLLDLYVVRGGLFHNLGGGNFQKILNSNLPVKFGTGTTWADYNNDGWIDCFISASPPHGSSLWKNNGNGIFTQIHDYPFSDSSKLTGWGSAWGDYNNDGYVDVVIAAAFGFLGISDGNKFLQNQSGQSFIRLDTSPVCKETAPYTVPTWSDYDQDGDIDLFIGSGPANGTLFKDYLFQNHLKESGAAYLTRITGTTLSDDAHDGQVWNFIDYDNDGDLDAYLTNYYGSGYSQAGLANELFRNDNGTFVKLTTAEAGSIVSTSDKGVALSNVWGDYDNDGDLDCFVTYDGTSKNKYYQNNGDGTFTKLTSIAPVSDTGPFYGATAGDYDNDGDLDLYIATPVEGQCLFRNDLSNGNSWVEINLEGTISNRSAIGAKVRAKAIIAGKSYWQLREVSAENSFDGMNALTTHFGLGDASIIDSLRIEWPSGLVEDFSAVNVNRIYKATEGQGITTGIHDPDSHEAKAALQAFPNPCAESCTILFSNPIAGNCSISVCDATGKIIRSIYKGFLNAGIHSYLFECSQLTAGIYLLQEESNSQYSNSKFIVTK